MKQKRLDFINLEEEVIKYLKDKYSFDFCVDELSKRGNGPFLTKKYIGYAYVNGKEQEKFTVWVDKKNKTITDSYQCLEINRIATDMLQKEADVIWHNAKVEFKTLLASEPSCNLEDYIGNNIRLYFENEFSDKYLNITVERKSDDEEEKIAAFLKAISYMDNGILRLKYEDYEQKGKVVLHFSAGSENISKALQSWSEK